jgi:hypothetical protein
MTLVDISFDLDLPKTISTKLTDIQIFPSLVYDLYLPDKLLT